MLIVSLLNNVTAHINNSKKREKKKKHSTLFFSTKRNQITTALHNKYTNHTNHILVRAPLFPQLDKLGRSLHLNITTNNNILIKLLY